MPPRSVPSTAGPISTAVIAAEARLVLVQCFRGVEVLPPTTRAVRAALVEERARLDVTALQRLGDLPRVVLSRILPTIGTHPHKDNQQVPGVGPSLLMPSEK